MNRVAFLVDGFNVYHSLREAETVLRRPLKWLDLRALCASYARRDLLGQTSALRSVTYFSAYATFLAAKKPSSLVRHRTYVEALLASGVDDCPVFHELHGLIAKTVGVVEPIRRALEPYADQIHAAFVYGSVASGTEDAKCDVDVMIINDALDHATAYQALEAAERRLARTISPTLLTTNHQSHLAYHETMEGEAGRGRLASSPCGRAIAPESSSKLSQHRLNVNRRYRHGTR